MEGSGFRIDKLGKENYDTWKVQIEALMSMNETWSYVTGDTSRPTVLAGDAASEAAAKKWDVADKKAKSTIILSMNAAETKQVKNCGTSKEMWDKLKTVYESKGPARMSMLLKKLTIQKMDEGQDVREHVASFFDTVDKLSEMDIDINESLLTMMLLQSLPSSFETFRVVIESRDTLPTPEALKIKIFEEADSMRKSGGNQDALFVKRKSEKSKNLNKNVTKNAPNVKTESFPFKCYKCKKRGHKASECLESKQKSAKAESEAFLATESNYSEQCVSFVEISAEQANRALSKIEEWCLDSGTTSHMCYDRNRFENKRESSTKVLNLASNDSTQIVGQGDVKLMVDDNDAGRNVKLHDTLYVPDLRTNLLSVARITEKGYSVLFVNDKATILNQSNQVIAYAPKRKGLYYLQLCEESAAKVVENKNRLQIWHELYGHLNEKSLREIVEHEKAIGVSFGKGDKLPVCEICLKGKIVQKPFPKESARSSELLEIVHTDLCGPMRVSSIGGSKYVLTFTDDYSRYSLIYFLRQKGEVLETFKKYKEFVENQSGRKIKCLQSDNGSEFVNREFDRFLEGCGINRRLTVPYTPEQNGVSERKNRTLIQMTRCLLLQSGLATPFWAEAMNTANHIRNRSPSNSLKGEVPYKLWTGKTPNVKYFKLFGSQAVCLNKDPKRGKLDPPGRDCVFVGYSEQSKAYRVWLTNESKIIVSRDVRFLDVFHKSDNQQEDFFEVAIPNENPENGQIPNQTEVIRDENPERVTSETVTEIREGDNGQGICLTKRGPGRPRKIRTGLPGRPKKEYNMIPVEEEFAGLTEIPVREALQSPEAKQWEEAIDDEFASILRSRTWEVVDRPQDRKVIGCRVVLRNKLKSDGTLERRKARLVAKGYAQEYGVDYDETFAPVARQTSIRLIASLAAELDMPVHQLDVKTAFLNGEISEGICIEIPDLLEESLTRLSKEKSNVSNICKQTLDEIQQGNKVLLLKKALYGLKQAGRAWYEKLDKHLRSMGFKPTNADPCVYVKGRRENLTIVAIYVDDLVIATRNIENMKLIKRELMNNFDMKDLGPIHYCLGVEFEQNLKKGQISMRQTAYIRNILDRFGMSECRAVTTPLDPGIKLEVPEKLSDEEMQLYPFRTLIGSLAYLSTCTRPDIAFAVSYLSQFNSNYRKEHWIAGKRVLRYLQGTKDVGITYKKEGKRIEGFVDSDWANCSNDRRSYTGYCFKIAGAVISWESRKQRTVALSSTEAEYMGLTEATKEAIHLGGFLRELGVADNQPVWISNDNQGAQSLARNPVFHGRSKHIDVRHHFVREAIQRKEINVKYLPTYMMPADILTKSLGGPKHRKCCDELGLVKISDKCKTE